MSRPEIGLGELTSRSLGALLGFTSSGQFGFCARRWVAVVGTDPLVEGEGFAAAAAEKVVEVLGGGVVVAFESGERPDVLRVRVEVEAG